MLILPLYDYFGFSPESRTTTKQVQQQKELLPRPFAEVLFLPVLNCQFLPLLKKQIKLGAGGSRL
jgi:hypothetical protein